MLQALKKKKDELYYEWIEKMDKTMENHKNADKEPTFMMLHRPNLYEQCKQIIKKYICLSLLTMKKMMNLSAFLCSCIATIMVYDWRYLFLSGSIDLIRITFLFGTLFLIILTLYLILYAMRELLHEKTYE